MKKKKLAAVTAVLILTAAALLTGCGSIGAQKTESTPAPTEDKNDVSATAETIAGAAATETISAAESELFTKRDLTQTADLSEAAVLTVADGETVTVTKAGVYVLTGSAENASVMVNAGDGDKVQMVLDGVSIVNAHQACIVVENADKVFLTSAQDSENSLTVSGKFTGDEDAVVFSRSDLVLNGLGTVNVSSTGDGIKSNDSLKLTGGTWIVSAADIALKAHESICAWDGVYAFTGGSDGLHAEDSDDTKGFIVILGGTFTIQAGDDGVHATTTVTVNGGTLAIEAAEGIEATQVIINDGTVSIRAADDGINAGRKSKSLSVKIEINGGEVTVVMGAGDTDGIDSNGDLIITGGIIDITAQSPFDYDGICSYTGGTIIVNGTETNSITNQTMGGGMQNG